MMNNTNTAEKSLFIKLEQTGCFRLLAEDGVKLSDPVLERIVCFLDLLKSWNDLARLVSKADLALLVERHIADSLSLVPVILKMGLAGGALLDIGSGGGFPAIPLKIVLPDLQVTLIERSGRKVGFLRKVVGNLGLSGVDIIRGNFPEVPIPGNHNVITARAIENPEKILDAVLGFLPERACFLCQRTTTPEVPSDMFHVEHIKDNWSAAGLRRGNLYVITKHTTRRAP